MEHTEGNQFPVGERDIITSVRASSSSSSSVCTESLSSASTEFGIGFFSLARPIFPSVSRVLFHRLATLGIIQRWRCCHRQAHVYRPDANDRPPTMLVVLTNCDFPAERTSNENETSLLFFFACPVPRSLANGSGRGNKCLPHRWYDATCEKIDSVCWQCSERCLLDISIRGKSCYQGQTRSLTHSHKYLQLTADKAQSGCSRWISLSCAFEQRGTLSRSMLTPFAPKKFRL